MLVCRPPKPLPVRAGGCSERVLEQMRQQGLSGTLGKLEKYRSLRRELGGPPPPALELTRTLPSRHHFGKGASKAAEKVSLRKSGDENIL